MCLKTAYYIYIYIRRSRVVFPLLIKTPKAFTRIWFEFSIMFFFISCTGRLTYRNHFSHALPGRIFFTRSGGVSLGVGESCIVVLNEHYTKLCRCEKERFHYCSVYSVPVWWYCLNRHPSVITNIYMEKKTQRKKNKNAVTIFIGGMKLETSFQLRFYKRFFHRLADIDTWLQLI